MKSTITINRYKKESRHLLNLVLVAFGQEYAMRDNSPQKYVDEGNGSLLNEIDRLLKKEVLQIADL